MECGHLKYYNKIYPEINWQNIIINCINKYNIKIWSTPQHRITKLSEKAELHLTENRNWTKQHKHGKINTLWQDSRITTGRRGYSWR